MADEAKPSWMNLLALSTIMLAVCATLSTFKGGGYSTRSIMAQTLASDQWSYYQSKSIKEYLYEIEKDRLELSLRTAPPSAKAAREEVEKVAASYGEKVKKYEQEKTDISAVAKKFEAERDMAKLHSAGFGIAVIFLQLAILLSSVAALMKNKHFWYASLVTGAVGLVYFADGFLLFLK